MDPPPAKFEYARFVQARVRPASGLPPQTRFAAIRLELHRHSPWLLMLVFAICVASKRWTGISSSWWLALVPLWVLPWREYLWTKDYQEPGALTVVATMLFSGLFYVEQTATIEAFGSWKILSAWRWGPVFSLPMQTILAGCATALLLAFPLHRIVGRHSKVVALICGLPYAISEGRDTAFVLERWMDHPLANAIFLFDMVMPALIFAKACELLNSCDRSPSTALTTPRPTGLYARFISGGFNSTGTFAIFLGAATLVYTGVRGRTHHAGELMGSATGSILFVCCFVVPFILMFLSSLALWRHSAKTSACWTMRIVAAAILVVPVTLASSGDAMWSGLALSNAIRSVPGPLWHVVAEGEVLRVSGEFSLGIGHAVERAIGSNPDVKLIELESGGGSAEEAMRVGRAIKRAHLSTHVQGHCESACTGAFVAGQDRSMSAGALLGFHACRPAVWYSVCDNPRYIAYLENNGIDSDFIRKGMEVPASDMWYPTSAELSAAHVITEKPR
jgi:hypothetical protein